MHARASVLVVLGALAASVLGRADFPKRHGANAAGPHANNVYQARQYDPHAGTHALRARQAGPSAVVPPAGQPTTCSNNAHAGADGNCVCNDGWSGPATACVLTPVVQPPITQPPPVVQPSLPSIASFHVTGAGTTLTNAAGQTVYQVPVGQTATLSSVVSVTPGSTNSFSVVASLSTGGSIRIIVTDATGTPAGRWRRSKAKRAPGDVLCDTGALTGTDVQAGINCFVGDATAVNVGYTVSGGTVGQPQAEYMYAGACQSNCGGSTTTPSTPVVAPVAPDVPSSSSSATSTSSSSDAAASTSTSTSTSVTPSPSSPSTTCPAGATVSGTTCTCSTGFSYVVASNTCATCNSLGAINGINGSCGATCPSSAVASGPTCVCPDASTYSSGQCLLCTSLGLAAGTGGQCSAVTDPTTSTDSTTSTTSSAPTTPTVPTTPTTCADGSSYDTLTASCSLCNSKGLLNGIGGACGAACPAGVTPSGSVCLCPLGSTYINSLCSTCTSLGLLNGPVAGTCGLPCPVGSTSAGTTCTCLPGTGYDSGTNACLSTCPTGTTWNPSTSVCECGVDATLTISGCASCASQGKLNSGTVNTCGAACPLTAQSDGVSCACPATSQLIAGVCVPCVSLGRNPGPVAGGPCAACTDVTQTLTGDSCGCPAGTSSPSPSAPCRCIAANTVLDGATCKCLATAQRDANGACGLCSDLGLVDGTTLDGACTLACLDPTKVLGSGSCSGCSSGTSIVAGVCVPCATQGKADGVNGACGPACSGLNSLVAGACLSCATQGLTDGAAGNGCGPACPLPSVLVAGACQCPVTGQTVVGGACVCSDANSEVVANSCTCKGGFALNASGQCISTCAATNALLGSAGSGGACGAVCPLSRFGVPSQDSAPTADGTQCACLDKSKTIYQGTGITIDQGPCFTCPYAYNSLKSTDGISCGESCAPLIPGLVTATANVAGDECVCLYTGWVWVGTSSVVPSGCRCPPGSINNDGRYPVGQPDEPAQNCVRCDPALGLTDDPSGTNCVCIDKSMFPNPARGGACTNCNLVYRRPSVDGLTCGGECPSGSILRDGNCACNAPNRVFRDEQCICPYPLYRGGYFGCTSCPSGSTVNSDASGCICDDKFSYFDSAQTRCFSCGSVYPNDGVTCGAPFVCPSGTRPAGQNACTCNNIALDYVNGQCVCPSTKWRNPNYQGCGSCPSGAYPSSDQSTCICPGGAAFDPFFNSCITCSQNGSKGPSTLTIRASDNRPYCQCTDPTSAYGFNGDGCEACPAGTRLGTYPGGETYCI